MKTIWDNVDFFEDLIAEYAGSKYAVAVDSCTNAIFLSLQTVDKRQDTTVTIPCRTYVSVPMQILHCNFILRFEDIEWSGLYKLKGTNVVDSAQRFTENMYIKDTLQCLSFHSKKILSIGRGGMILTDDKHTYEWLKKARYDGRESIYYNDIPNAKEMPIGWHMYMTPEQAVRGVEQFYRVGIQNDDSGSSQDYGVDLSKLDCFKQYTL